VENLSNSPWRVRRLREGWGKLRRLLLCNLRRGLVRERIAKRAGACRGCAECCDLMFRCPYLGQDRRCTIYEKRFKPCADYPIDERDNRWVDCGFSFPDAPVDGTGWKSPVAPWAAGETALIGLACLAGAGSGLGMALVDGIPAGYAAAAAFGLLLAGVLFFFRDPRRSPPAGSPGLVAPADGRVTDVSEVDEPEFLGGRALRVGIFMSLLDVHVNRAPCDGEVRMLRRREGTFADARREEAWAKNENALLGLRGEAGPVAVRLVAGAVARRIALGAAAGDKVRRGERIGMVKFGSRAEVLVPAGGAWKAAAKPGDRVRAGETVVLVREPRGDERTDD
jgi:phosphatidylserine decarboxylase